MEKIAIFGVTRSGTSWLGQIFNSAPNVKYLFQPIHSYSFPFVIDEKSSSLDLDLFYQQLQKTTDPYVLQVENISGNATPSFFKTKVEFIVWKEVRYLSIIENLVQKTDTKVVFILRYPCSVISSWINAPREFNSSWSIFEKWEYATQKNSCVQIISATARCFRVC